MFSRSGGKILTNFEYRHHMVSVTLIFSDIYKFLKMTNLRRSAILWELKDVKFMIAEPLDFSRTQQLPSFRHLIQRFFTLLKDKDSTVNQVCNQGEVLEIPGRYLQNEEMCCLQEGENME